MNITILTTGSRGDTQPFIALGKELKTLGHEVTITAFENYRELVDQHGLGFSPIQGDISAITKEMAKLSIKSKNPVQFFTSFRKMKPLLAEKQVTMQADLFAACERADAILYHPGAAIGHFIGKEKGIPAILASPFPMGETEEYPSLIFYKMQFGKTLNRLTNKWFEKGFWMTVKTPIRTYWKQRFGQEPAGFKSPYSKRDYPMVTSVSQHVFPQADDESASFGYWFLDEDLTNWQPPQPLQAFLENGKQPVYIGFGSTYDDQAIETTEMMIEALRRTGQRGILATGWNEERESVSHSDDIFFTDSIPHTWLFPKLAGVVHHGGAGTTAATFRSGVPGLVIPHGNDQFAWGKRTEELGVGPSPIPKEKLTTDKLEHGIRQMLTPAIQQKADQLGSRLQQENGARDTALYLQEILTGSGPSSQR
ncbi:glycosyltransferase [Halobacillus salinus]|nr:glycosyltransferase [Halobacillus salinus]